MFREPRAHKRYIVSGVAQLETGGSRFPGQVITLGGGGMLVRSEATPPPTGTPVGVDFSVSGFAMEPPLQASSTVVWTQPGKIGLKFLEAPPGLSTLLSWLEREHAPWTGVEEGPKQTP